MGALIWYTKVMDKIQTIVAVPFKWVLAALMGLIVFEVFMRYILRAPTIWGLDFRQQMYAVLIMIGSSYTLMVKGHVIVDFFTMKFSYRGQRILNILMWLILYIPPISVLTYTMFNLAAQAWRLWEGSGTIWNPPVYPLKTLLVIAYFNLLLQGIAELFKDIISLQKGNDDWIKER